MSIQFSRTLRSLHVDSFRASRIGLLLALVLAVALLAWFFFAQVTLYEVSTDMQVDEDGRVLALFAPEKVDRIQVGQQATVRLQLEPNQQPVAYPAIVFNPPAESGEVELLLTEGEYPPVSGSSVKGQAEVEVEHISPLEMVLRAAGRYASPTQ